VLLRASQVTSLFPVVEIKVDVRLLAQTYHRKREESRDANLFWAAVSNLRSVTEASAAAPDA
jgi:hypothetical protein